MKKRVVVLSLGGSLIIPDEVNLKYLEKFKKTLQSLYKTHKFVVVCGGGSTARKYIKPLLKAKKSHKEVSAAGIRATRTNAKLLMQYFGKKEANDTLPMNMKQVKSNLSKNSVVFCGALRYADKETSDGTAAKLANYLDTIFINLTNVPGLYTDNPKTHKNAKFISEISWANFEKKALKLKFKAGQHFILDQSAATLIKKKKITTYIVGEDISNLKKILQGKKFKGTKIQD